MRHEPKPYQVYRHFKGNIYQVIMVAKHTETGEKLVIYKPLFDDKEIFARPLSMFLSEVDHEKYPLVTQKYRFSLITGPKSNKSIMAGDKRIDSVTDSMHRTELNKNINEDICVDEPSYYEIDNNQKAVSNINPDNAEEIAEAEDATCENDIAESVEAVEETGTDEACMDENIVDEDITANDGTDEDSIDEVTKAQDEEACENDTAESVEVCEEVSMDTACTEEITGTEDENSYEDTESEENYILDPDLERFLDEKSPDNKLIILAQMKKRLTPDMIRTISTVLELKLNGDNVNDNYYEIVNFLSVKAKFEADRLRK